MPIRLFSPKTSLKLHQRDFKNKSTKTRTGNKVTAATY